jgi:opacity protein-like surface antigen
VPLAPGDWSFLKGVQPYALFNPSTVRPIGGVQPALSGLLREPAEDSWKGLGVGAGVQWHLSDRLDLFGQYQFLSLPGADTPTGSPLTRREAEGPGVKAGLSIHF